MKEKQHVSNATTDTRELLAQQGVVVGKEAIEYAGMLSGYLVDVIEFDQTTGITGIEVPFSINDILHGLMRLRQCRQLLEKVGIETYPCQIFGDQPVPLDWLQASEGLICRRSGGVLTSEGALAPSGFVQTALGASFRRTAVQKSKGIGKRHVATAARDSERS